MPTAGDHIRVVVSNMDGSPRRSWTAEIEAIDKQCVRTITRIGNPVGGPKGGWSDKSDSRAFYWFSRPYNLVEMYNGSGALTQLYVHIASPVRIVDGELLYTDYELDVVRRRGRAPFTIDADEFEQALTGHRAAAGLRTLCYRAVDEVTRLLWSWDPRGPFATLR